MDSSGVLIEEQKLMTEQKYRVYMSNIDKALKNFEYSSEWADLISALGKLNKAISSNTQYQVIPRRIKISKRLAQCMHPALPSGVHLKALETYDVIFSKTGPEILATELFIYSAGLFPLLGYAAMNVRPTLLGIYETYFVPLGDKLRPALSGFLCGVITGYESGLDHFDRTSSLLNQVCNAVNPTYFYTCLWECVATNASIRLPAVSYLLDHFNKRLGMHEQPSIMGKSHDVLMSGLTACLNDPVILVQRNTLEFLLLGFPMHTNLLTKNDCIRLVTNGLNTILRRDMSLNRRLYSWLLGSEVIANRSAQGTDESGPQTVQSYFELHSKDVLIQALKCTLKISLQTTPVDLKPYRILVSLLDKVEIGPAVLDHVLFDVIRTMSLSHGNAEVSKSANLLFATFDPSYIWNFMTMMYEKSCKISSEPTSKLARSLKATTQTKPVVPEVDSGDPGLCEVCYLTEFLLETITLEMYNETTRVYLPRVFLSIIQMLTVYSESLSYDEVTGSLKLCMKIVSRVQPMITSPVKAPPSVSIRPSSEGPTKNVTIEGNNVSLEKSKSDSKINQSAHDDDDEPIRRSNSNHNIIKKSPKKTKKSKSYSKLLELDKDISSSSDQLSAISATDLDIKKSKTTKKFSPSMKIRNLKGKSAQDLKIQSIGNTTKSDQQTLATTTTTTITTSNEQIIDENSIKLEFKSDFSETTSQEYSILEMCIKQYETFFQVYLASQILDIKSVKRSSFSVISNLSINQIGTSVNNLKIVEDEYGQRVPEINAIFETLKLNDKSQLSELHSLLHKTIKNNSSNGGSGGGRGGGGGGGGDTSDCDYKDCFSSNEKLDTSTVDGYDENAEKSVNRLMNLKLCESLRASVKLASNLLIEMSTFPNNNQNLVNIFVLDIPPWLKVLVLIATYCKTDKELQISAIQTLFDLISLLKSQSEHSSNPGVTYVVMLPLLKFGHVTYLETKTRVIQVITSTLWNLITDRQVDSNQICSLLYQLHNCLSSGLVETVIGHRMANTHLEWSNTFSDPSSNRTDRTSSYKINRLTDIKILCTSPSHSKIDVTSQLTESESLRFRKFEILWEYGRGNQSPRGFEKTLFKVYDFLALPYHISIRAFVTKWLQESLLRSDLNRLIKPLLRILLASNTKRISVLHAHLLRKYSEENYHDAMQDRGIDDMDSDTIIDKDVYAISSEDGHIKYHMEMTRNKKRSPIRSLQKKFFGVTIGNKNKTSNYISDKSLSPTENANISLIVNPMDNSVDLEIIESTDSIESQSNHRIEIAEPNSVIHNSPPKEDYFSSCEEETDESFSDTESERHDESLDRDISLPNTDIKRFAGDCERVSEILTEHDRTKNRKTYNVTKSSSKVIEKMPMAPEVSDGICIQTEESTPAEDYFSNSASLGGGSVIDGNTDLLDQISESYDDNTSSTSKSIKSIKNTVQRSIIDRTQNDDCSHKRLSSTSKVSSDSNNSSNISRDKLRHSTNGSNNGYESDPCDEKFNRDSADRQSNLSKSSQPISENYSKSSPILQTNWEKAQETLEISKKNVEVLRNSAMQENPKFFDRKSMQSRHHKRHYDRLHPLHTHMLLYYGVYDTKQVLYAIQTMRNIIACDCRTFLCLSITTSLSNNTLKQLLVRHRKSIFGKGFSGSIVNTEFSHAYRGCMYLEVLVTVCLYYARSYFQNEFVEANKMPTEKDISSNCKIQLASIELLTTMCNELILIVKDMGKGLACYIADLMAKCKLQKIILNCIISCVHLYQSKHDLTLTEKIIDFNTLDDDHLHAESLQIQLLRLLMSVIKLESEVNNQKGEELAKTPSSMEPGSGSPTRLGPHTPTNTKYLPNCLISQQPMFLYAILKALQSDHLRHLHRNWTDLVTSSLNCFTAGSLTNIVISVIHQLCGNIDEISKGIRSGSIPLDYAVSQLEAVTVLCHYCLLENSQQTSLSHLFNQCYPQISASTQSSTSGGQLLNNIVHAILSTPQSSENQTRSSHILAARNAVLSHLPVIIASVARLWDTKIGQSRQVKQQLLEFLSPISLHHGSNFLAAMSVTWQERGDVLRQQRRDSESSSSRKNSYCDISASFLPYACPDQLSLVKLVSNIRVMPMDSFVQTLHQVVKSPPNIHHPPPGLCIEVSALELFYFYMKAAAAPQLGDCWTSLLALLRDGLNLIPPAQFVILAILNEFVQRCPQMPFQDRKDIRDLHDVSSRLVEALSNVAGARLEQTTWLRRNLAVKEDLPEAYIDGSFKEVALSTGNQQYSVQAQSVMAAVLANLLDVAYGSQEKDKVVTIITTLMYNITPYLKNHTFRNIPSFYACSQLLANLSGYQYTRKAWRKDTLDLVLDPCFFQMDMSCLPFWKQILDSLMTYDNTTFRELMSRVSLTQTGGLNLFTSREQEYEQRALLLKRLAFVIFCSELDQYHKYMPEIQEQLANSLRLPSVVPAVQAAVFLCFRVLLLRMSPDHVTSLWPTIIAEMVQVFLAIEQELKADNEEFSQQLRLLSGMDAPWATNPNNGILNQHHLAHWRSVQLETAKLLELSCVLPATNLPYFQMYRWAFVGSQYDTGGHVVNGTSDDVQVTSSLFIPHIRRIARLMDLRFTTHSPKPQCKKGHYLTLTCQNISNLQDLYGFFSTLGAIWPPHNFDSGEKHVNECLAEIEHLLAADFLEKMPSNNSAR